MLNKNELVKQFKQDITAEEVWLHASVQRERHIQQVIAASPVSLPRIAGWFVLSFAAVFLATFIIAIVTNNNWFHTLLILLGVWLIGHVVCIPIVLRLFGTDETWLTRHRYQELRAKIPVGIPNIVVKSYSEDDQIVTDIVYNGYAHRIEAFPAPHSAVMLVRCERRNRSVQTALSHWIISQQNTVAELYPDTVPHAPRPLIDENKWGFHQICPKYRIMAKNNKIRYTRGIARCCTNHLIL